jgi:hypothetical protein
MKANFSLGDYVDMKQLADIKKGYTSATTPIIHPPKLKIDVDPKGEIKKLEEKRDYGFMDISSLSSIRTTPANVFQKIRTLRKNNILKKESFGLPQDTVKTLITVIVLILIIGVCFYYWNDLRRESLKIWNEFLLLLSFAKPSPRNNREEYKPITLSPVIKETIKTISTSSAFPVQPPFSSTIDDKEEISADVKSDFSENVKEEFSKEGFSGGAVF